MAADVGTIEQAATAAVVDVTSGADATPLAVAAEEPPPDA